MTTIDHQQAAVLAGAEALWKADPTCFGVPAPKTSDEGAYETIGYTEDSRAVITAAAPHLRAGMADELLDDTPGSPLTRGYQRLIDPKPGEHPVRTWEAAVRVMLDTLLEGGGEDK